ncbi:hypothetical protein CYLTODRAFT_408819 [Cylindrobasidium torrendii FP15055 ss-10]|uniref:Uncharacterized protein n=1 Tax=Cylindrobasidium torrendii FP15055 ss-10 TaxID=1314674 RepID=A0A0D7BIS8_9AGAR|nr:hypothetical protein CYLTODRAFT_408819 [Cylindrobasidium torrendii FP15055 ss-10]
MSLEDGLSPKRLRDVKRQLLEDESENLSANKSREPAKLFDFTHPDSEHLATQNPDLVIASAFLILLDSYHNSEPYRPVIVTISSPTGSVGGMMRLWAGSGSMDSMDYRPLLEAYGAADDLLTTNFGTNAFRAAYCGILAMGIWPSELLSDAAAEEEQDFLDYVTDYYAGRYGLTALAKYDPRGLTQAVKEVESQYGRHHGFVIVPLTVWNLMKEIFEGSRNEIKYKERKEVSRAKFEKWKNSPERFKRPSDTPRAQHLVERDNARELAWRPKKVPEKRPGSPLKRQLT